MRVLEDRYRPRNWARGMSAFEVLVSTVLSQSTTVANERRGMDGLREAFGDVRPSVLARAPVRRIEAAIWHAGLARRKAARIREIARIVERRWGGSLDGILSADTAAARSVLLSLPGVGPKTADVVLAVAGAHPTFPVDTHVARIARRWNLARDRGYEAVRGALEAWTPPEKRLPWHWALIAHGREVCRARAPRCDACPVSRDCDWYLARSLKG